VLGNRDRAARDGEPADGAQDVRRGRFRPPTTNPIAFDRPDGRIWIVGTSAFDFAGNPTESGFLAWKVDGSQSWSDVFGVIPGRFPMRSYAPAVGAEELAVVSDGTDAWVYSLLRDPDPSSAFVRAAAVGVVRFLGNVDPVVSKLLSPGRMGEPFSIPTVWNGRVAIESSEGPPWWATPPGGSEDRSSTAARSARCCDRTNCSPWPVRSAVA
jgi:hypothetical protein